MEKETSHHAISSFSPPKYVGGYRLGRFEKNYIQFNMAHRPNWLHRQFMRIFLGWYWFDNIEVTTIVK